MSSLFLKQSTARTIVLGPFVDDTDGKTAETGLAISQADVRLSKNAGTFAQKSDATACTHMEHGYYSCPLDTTDTGTLGSLDVGVMESGALHVWATCNVITAKAYDALFSTGLLDVNVTQISGDSTAADNLEAATDGTGYNIGNGSVVAASVTAAVGITGDLSATMKTSVTTAASAATPVATVSGDLSATMKTSVQTAATASLNAYDPPTRAELTSDVSALATASSIAALNNLSSAQAQTAAAAALTAYDPPTHAELTSGLASADDATLAAIAALNNVSTAQVQTSAAAALTAYDPPTHAELTSGLAGADDAVLAAVAALNNLSAAGVRTAIGLATANLDTQLAGIPDAVWDEPISESDFGHSWSGATMRRVAAAKFAGFRNKWTSTNSAKVLRNDADSATLGTRSISDNGTTYTDGEMG